MGGMNDAAQFALLFKNQFRQRVDVHVATAIIHGNAEDFKQIAQTATKAPFDVRRGNVVATVRHPFGHAQPGHFNARQRQVYEFNPPAFGAQAAHPFQIATSGQRGLKRKILALLNADFNFCQKQTAGGQQLTLWCKRR